MLDKFVRLFDKADIVRVDGSPVLFHRFCENDDEDENNFAIEIEFQEEDNWIYPTVKEIEAAIEISPGMYAIRTGESQEVYEIEFSMESPLILED